MKHIIVTGGLGNQMFIFAFYYAFLKSGEKVRLDTSLYNVIRMHNGYELPFVFGISKDNIHKGKFHTFILRLILKSKFYLQIDQNKFISDVFKTSKKYYWGYWQTDKYFNDYRNEIVNIFSFKHISQYNMSIAETMKKIESVSLHIRRGDYLLHDQYANICTEVYYNSAIKLIKEKIENPIFYIFSNDIQWSKAFANRHNINYIIIAHNSGKDSYQDMFLMSQCKHNILANSSFSWWGAYLNQYSNAIKIAPKKWDNTDSQEYNKLRVPSSYIRI